MLRNSRPAWGPGALAAVVAAGCGLSPSTPNKPIANPAPAVAGQTPVSKAAVQNDAAVPMNLDGTPLTVYVQATKDGFSPSTVSIPQGARVRMVLVNHDQDEHHFHVLGLRGESVFWLVPTNGNGHNHGDEPVLTVNNPGDDTSGTPGATAYQYTSTHPCEHFCVAGLCYTKNTIHTYAPPGGTDEVIFTPKYKGEFPASDALNPQFQATVRVF